MMKLLNSTEDKISYEESERKRTDELNIKLFVNHSQAMLLLPISQKKIKFILLYAPY